MDYDALFKQVLLSPESRLLRALAGANAVEQLNCEFLSVERRASDIICRLTDGRILHVEVQASNDSQMAWRMAHYFFLVARRYPDEPLTQILLYVGNAEMRMPAGIDLPNFQFRYHQVDIRELDQAQFLESPVEAELAISILCGDGPPEAKIQLLVNRWCALNRRQRDSLIEQLVIASKLRGDAYSRLEIRQMAIEFTEAEELAKEQAVFEMCDRLTQGRLRASAERDTTLANVKLLMRAKFGGVPEFVDQHLAILTRPELETLLQRVLTAPTVDALFDRQRP